MLKHYNDKMRDSCFFDNEGNCIDEYELYVFSLCFYDYRKKGYRKQYTAKMCKNNEQAIKWGNEFFELRKAQILSVAPKDDDFSFMLYKPIKNEFICKSEVEDE